MITFEARQKPLQYAGIIERKAHNIYPHISCSKLDKRYIHAYSEHKFPVDVLDRIYEKVIVKLRELRAGLRNTDVFYTDLIYGLQEKKVGNCFEEAVLAELIGKLNGQKNIYVGNIFVKKENVENKRKIDHCVAFITDKKIQPKEEYSFKNKEAIIIDPWLGITDYADKYFTQLKNHFRKYFDELPNQDFLEYLIGSESKNSEEFRQGRKNSCQDLKFNIELAHNLNLNTSKQKVYKSFFPELVIKKYKKIKLAEPNKTKPIAKKESL